MDIRHEEKHDRIVNVPPVSLEDSLKKWREIQTTSRVQQTKSYYLFIIQLLSKNLISLIFWFLFYLFLSQYNFSVTFNLIFLNFIHNCHRVKADGPSFVKQTQNGLLADGEWTSDTHYNRSAIWVVFWPNGPHTASQLSNRYLPLLEDQVCEVGANITFKIIQH